MEEPTQNAIQKACLDCGLKDDVVGRATIASAFSVQGRIMSRAQQFDRHNEQTSPVDDDGVVDVELQHIREKQQSISGWQGTLPHGQASSELCKSSKRRK